MTTRELNETSLANSEGRLTMQTEEKVQTSGAYGGRTQEAEKEGGNERALPMERTKRREELDRSMPGARRTSS